jgi:mRNA interferase MazF
MPTSDLARFDPFDVVIVPFPYSDRLGEKHRPAVVISNRKLSTLGLIWLAMITSAENPPWPGDVQISDLEVGGLPAPSTVRPTKIACIESSRILRRAGKLDRATARMVSQRIRGLLS